MAGFGELKIGLTDEFSKALEETRKELEAARAALTEECIRQIVREELADWEKRQRQTRGWTAMETK